MSRSCFSAGRLAARGVIELRKLDHMRDDQIVTQDKDVLGGTPAFTGTRVPVDTLMAHLKAGDPLDVFLADFPSVSREQAKTFLELAQR